MSSRSVQPRLKITLDDGTVRYTENLTKRKVSGILTNLRNNMAIITGTARVIYSPAYYNEFDFDSEDDFKDKILPCIEKELVDDFKMVKA